MLSYCETLCCLENAIKNNIYCGECLNVRKRANEFLAVGYERALSVHSTCIGRRSLGHKTFSPKYDLKIVGEMVTVQHLEKWMATQGLKQDQLTKLVLFEAFEDFMYLCANDLRDQLIMPYQLELPKDNLNDFPCWPVDIIVIVGHSCFKQPDKIFDVLQLCPNGVYVCMVIEKETHKTRHYERRVLR